MSESTDAIAYTAVHALVEIGWMARRVAHQHPTATVTAFNEATWLLHQHAHRVHLSVGHPDQTANRDYDNEVDRLIETPSYYADGTPVDFQPTPERVEELTALPAREALAWAVSVIHPLAHSYADGRSTYASSAFNGTTRALRNARFDLSPTVAAHGSVFVRDGMGDAYTGLSAEETAERDQGLLPGPRRSRG